ncbi:HAD family hydrolase [Paenibacillus swuensis]|uniref:Acid sugar phosphatase n=1 Tax=Paenibacillus swuensis TaxID=1178515 RepID=A0A172TLE8_9BACL|nr:TIGR01457 family HAD-type hydrolase [Paenibacillus swuensis]ANE47858.1 HAD family hydrolase [Paenibacillus swuensis]
MIKNFGKKIGLFIDLDGTVYHGARMIPYADQWIRNVRSEGIPFLFVTNNSSRTPVAVAQHLIGMGIEALPDEVYTSAQAAAQYVNEQQLGKDIFCIGEIGLRVALQEKGLSLSDCMDDSVDVVVQGIDREFNYLKLEKAVTALLKGASFIQTNPDLLLPSDHGLIPGAGTLGASIQAGSRVKPVVIGKPSPIIMEYALAKLGCLPEQAIVIGDNMFTDIGAGRAAGCHTVLVLTGVTTSANYDEQVQLAGFEPDHVCKDIEELSAYISLKNRL